MGQRLTSFLIVLLVSNIIAAGNEWVEISVFVADQNGRPIEGANVILQCEYYKQYMPTKTVTYDIAQSDSEGICYANAKFEGPFTLKLSCYALHPASVIVTYCGRSETVAGTWGMGLNRFTVILPDFYEVKINVVDQNGNPIKDVEVTATPAESGTCPQFKGTTNEGGVVAFKQIPSSSTLLLYMVNGGEEKYASVNIGAGDTEQSIVMNTYSLSLSVVDGGDKPIRGATINVSREGYSTLAETGPDGIAVIDGLQPATYSYKVISGKEKYAAEVELDKDKRVDVVLGSTAGSQAVSSKPAAVEAPASSKWFLNLMDSTDELLLSHKEAMASSKMRVVFVPIGYSQNDSEEFKELARQSVARFKEVSPFRECESPLGEIEVHFMEPSDCNITGCSDICGLGTDATENCQKLISDCSNSSLNPYRERFNFTIGLCKGSSCGGNCGGCTAGIPSDKLVVNSDSCGGAPANRIVTHELGHALGLFHVLSTNGLNGCWDTEAGACQGANAADCALPDLNVSKMIMAYCPSMEEYGPAGYAFLRDSALKEYIGVCT